MNFKYERNSKKWKMKKNQTSTKFSQEGLADVMLGLLLKQLKYKDCCFSRLSTEQKKRKIRDSHTFIQRLLTRTTFEIWFEALT